MGENLTRNRPGKEIEPNVKKFQIIQSEDCGWEWTGKLVVADVEFVEVFKIGDVSGENSGEIVGIGVENRDIRELIEEAVESWGGEMETVEIDCGDGCCCLIVGWIVAVEACVAANVGTGPCIGDSERVGGDCGFKFLDCREN